LASGAIPQYDGVNNFIGGEVGNTSNVIFSWNGSDVKSDQNYGLYQGTDLTPDTQSETFEYQFFCCDESTYRTVLRFKFRKIAGISTVSIYSRMWGDSSTTTFSRLCKVDIGGVNNYVETDSNGSPVWCTPSDIDISSLTDDTVYEGQVQLANETDTQHTYMSAIILIGS